MRLPDEIRRAIAESTDVLRFEDEETRAVYVLLDENTHRRAMRALREQEDWEAVQRGLADREVDHGQPMAEVDAEIREEFGFPPRP